MIIDDLPSISIANDSDEIAIEQGTATKKITKGNFLQEVTGAISSLLSSLSGKVSKAGDIVTGNLAVKSTNIADGTVPSSDTYGNNRFVLYDADGNTLGYLSPEITSNNRVGAMFLARRVVNGAAHTNGVTFFIDAGGNKTVSLSVPAAWLSALGLGTSGALPITVAQGGTGQTGVTSTSTLSQIATAASGFTFSGSNFSQWGKVGILRIGITKNVAWSGAQTAGTVVSGKRTITQCALVCYTNPYITGYLNPDGAITINSAMTINANSTYYFYAIYFLA